MITLLNNFEIDRKRWDTCIVNSGTIKPYAFSWYLDIMAPGWKALVEDNYESVFPVPACNRFGIKYIATPVFLQQLGLFSSIKPDEGRLTAFLEHIPEEYKLIDLRIGQNTDLSQFIVTERTNFELDLSVPYEQLYAHFISDCRRNIIIGEKTRQVTSENITPDELIDLFIRNHGKTVESVKNRDYERLRKLMNYCIASGKGRIVGVRSAENTIISGIFLVLTEQSVTVLFTANSVESRDLRTGYFLVNIIIKEFALSPLVLNFAGSSIPSIASFMKSFGCINIPYYRLYCNRLPWLLKMFK